MYFPEFISKSFIQFKIVQCQIQMIMTNNVDLAYKLYCFLYSFEFKHAFVKIQIKVICWIQLTPNRDKTRKPTMWVHNALF